jgi:hypothetical protein
MQPRYPAARVGNRCVRYSPAVFFFFSNRFGCLGSLVLSVVLTLVLMAVLRAL